MAFTFFFRDSQPLEFAADCLVEFASGKSNIKIWNPGCASGQEPFTFAIILSEKMGRFAFKNVKIQCTDIDISNLFGSMISEGIYPFEQLQRIPKDYFEKYFKNVKDDLFQIDYSIRSKLTYQKHDLTTLKPVGDEFCLIICKNVLLHLSESDRIKVIEMFYKTLMPDGFLVMENTQKLPGEFNNKFVKVKNNAQLYSKI